ncbi:glutamate transport system substrate-binding protein [Kibdelosporangium banguiense]|uniref:Glutamate transport system substrate-binding protein n=1 Tax=Kibdelosporangium banguiense TaxID=1365924 RepID=A0ABS4TBC8_9PSEU|nr:glutamate ABC transporter substrate-binding protein [Kibdelosporangium banguiense]MBP2321715.1 glutamate transport system substrate-binding protein [Kibdelosporangium banguiense]
MRGAVVCAAVGMLLVAGCGGGEEPPAGPKLTVGIRFDQPGLGVRMSDGAFSGLDVDVAEYVAGRMGTDHRNITFVEARPADRETMLEQNKVDMVIATYSITDARKQRVDFAGPYFVAGQSLLVRKANADIDGPESLDNSDWRLCSVTGSTPAENVQQSYAKSVTLQQHGSYRECVDALLKGDIDAVTTDDVILAGYAAEQPDKLKVVGKTFSTERYGVGLRKGDARRPHVTTALREMVNDGSWERFVHESVGRSGYRIPARPEIVDSP